MVYTFTNMKYGELLPVTNISVATKLDIRFANGYIGRYTNISPGSTYSLDWQNDTPLQADTIRVRLVCYDRYSYLQINGARITSYNITVENSDEGISSCSCYHPPKWDCDNKILTNGIFQRVSFETWKDAVGDFMKMKDVVKSYNNIRLPTITCDDQKNVLPTYTFYMPYDYRDPFGNTHNQHTIIPIYTGVRAVSDEKQIIHLSLPEGRLYDAYRIVDDAEQYMDDKHIILRYIPWGLRIDNVYAGEVIGKATILKINNGRRG